jgi:DNA-binding MarR family transcriptional regulator
MGFDALVANAGRLTILTELAVEERQEFVHLRRRTRLTDGNLAAHARRLEAAGLIAIDKQFRDGKPVTTYLLTPDGRKALESHARRLFAAITQRRVTAGIHTTAPLAANASSAQSSAEVHHDEDNWID